MECAEFSENFAYFTWAPTGVICATLSDDLAGPYAWRSYMTPKINERSGSNCIEVVCGAMWPNKGNRRDGASEGDNVS